MEKTGKCFIIGAGEFGQKKWNIQDKDLLIAADGGLLYARKLELMPDIVIGDMDSLCSMEMVEEAKTQGTEVITLPKEKDDTDMLAAIKVGLERGYQDFVLLGAMGGRMDHSIANIQCLIYLKNHGANGVIMDETQCLEVIYNEKKNFKPRKEGYFSAFCIGKTAKHVTEKGLKYEVEDALFSNEYPIGVSNEFIGKEAYIEVKEGMLLICYPCNPEDFMKN